MKMTAIIIVSVIIITSIISPVSLRKDSRDSVLSVLAGLNVCHSSDMPVPCSTDLPVLCEDSANVTKNEIGGILDVPLCIFMNPLLPFSKEEPPRA
jgi:hypothetical protein